MDVIKVASIAESIRAVGLLNPPAVRMATEVVINGEVIYHVPVLVHGHHRIRALQLIGETIVECVIIDADDDHAKLMEVDENLARAELGPAEERWHIRLHEMLVDRIKAKEEADTKENTGKSFSSIQKGPGQPKKFAAELSDLTGEAKQGINRKLAEAREIGDELKRITGTSLDVGVELAALAKMPKEDRTPLIERAVAGEKVSARTPEAKPDKPRAATPAKSVSEDLIDDPSLDTAMMLFRAIPAEDIAPFLSIYEKSNKHQVMRELRKLHQHR